MTMTQAEIKNRVIARDSEDGEFRAQLLTDPREAVHQLTGMMMPDSLKVQVHEESATSFHLMLPPGSRLTEAELAQVFAGGGWACYCGSNHPSF